MQLNMLIVSHFCGKISHMWSAAAKNCHQSIIFSCDMTLFPKQYTRLSWDIFEEFSYYQIHKHQHTEFLVKRSQQNF